MPVTVAHSVNIGPHFITKGSSDIVLAMQKKRTEKKPSTPSGSASSSSSKRDRTASGPRKDKDSKDKDGTNSAFRNFYLWQQEEVPVQRQEQVTKRNLRRHPSQATDIPLLAHKLEIPYERSQMRVKR